MRRWSLALLDRGGSARKAPGILDVRFSISLPSMRTTPVPPALPFRGMIRRDRATSSAERECGIRSRDRLGMDQRLAIETQIPALPARLREALVIGEIEMDAVKDCETEGAGGEKAEAERGQHRQAVARVPRVKVIGEIRCAHDEATEALTRRGDLRYTQNAERRFHHAPDGQAVAGTIGGQYRLRLVDLLGALDSGQQYAIDRHARSSAGSSLPHGVPRA
jgi:hypothetical protein